MELKPGQVIDVTPLFKSANVSTVRIVSKKNIGSREAYDLVTTKGWFVTKDGIVCKQCAGWSLSAVLQKGLQSKAPNPRYTKEDEIVVVLDDGFEYAIHKDQRLLVKRNDKEVEITASELKPGDEILKILQ